MRNALPNACVEQVRVTPTLPERGRQPKGAGPLDPPGKTSHTIPVQGMLHGAGPDGAASARSPIVILVAIHFDSFFLTEQKRDS
jgi:hypothetical protein